MTYQPSPSSRTILGPYGEGYCPVCRFVVGLTPRGLLEGHYRGTMNEYQTSSARCKGSDRRPAKKIPYASRKSAFRVRVAMDTCTECGLRVEVVDGALAWHTIFRFGGEKCPGSGKRVN